MQHTSGSRGVERIDTTEAPSRVATATSPQLW
jgi:hypothetical protein